MDFEKLVKERFSCRSFSKKPVEREKIKKIIELSMSAPTAKNLQPYKIFSVESESAKEIIKKSTPCIFNADTFLVIASQKEEAWVRRFDDKNFADVDASIVACHTMLAIKDLGLDTTWVGHFDAPFLKENIEQMKNLELIAIFPIGYADDEGIPSTRHYERKDVADILITI